MARPSRSRRPNRPKQHARHDANAETTCKPKRKSCELPAKCRPKSHCRSDVPDAADLCTHYLAILNDSKAAPWRELWELMITHPWFVRRLEQCSRTALRSSHLPDQLVDDVKHEVILRFAAKLRRTPDLCLDRDRAEIHFAGWMHTILSHECRMAIRTLRRLHFRTAPLLVDNADNDTRELLDDRMDLQQALSQLDADDSSVLLLQLQGCDANEIAELLDVSLSTAYRIIHRANVRLERKMR
ncbi:MAG: sigma-70 family RNA polymerase sigma factor [Planctomycetes bacterium]|nr:sigma-70 family RNA polymerase sigma factor [Planctomycetota bacterium]